MNARALFLLTAVLACGGGFGYFLTREAPHAKPGDGPLVSGPGAARATVPSDEPTQHPTLERAQLTGLAAAWTIHVVGQRGEPLSEASITARLGDSVQTAKSIKGRATFTGLEPGTWRLTVSSDGLPTWDEAVPIEGGGKETRTVVKLTNQIRVAGNVVDQRGEAVGGVSLWLLRESESHPTDASTMKGLITVNSTADGRFQLETAEPGRWKVSVGRVGEEPRYMSQSFELTHGKERRATVVVPARARLTIEVTPDDFKGPNHVALLAQREGPPPAPVETTKSLDGDTTETQESGAVAAEQAEAIRRKRAALGEASSEGSSDEGFAKAQNLEQLTAEQRQRVQEAEERQVRERQRTARIIEEGWITVRSARFEQGALGQINDLPEGKPLRFVLYRGIEGLQISETLIASQGASAHLTLSPPPPFPPAAELPDFPRVAPSHIELTPLGPNALPLGLTFEE